MANARLELIPDMGDDAMKDGCLSKKWVNRFLRRIRRRFDKVHLPNWLEGAAKFNEFEDTVELDLSNVKQVGVGAGTHVSPYQMLKTASTICVDTWSITAPPVGTDGVIWDGPRIIYAVRVPDETTTDSATHTTTWTILDEYLLSRICTYDSAGRLVAISAEAVVGFWGAR